MSEAKRAELIDELRRDPAFVAAIIEAIKPVWRGQPGEPLAWSEERADAERRAASERVAAFMTGEPAASAAMLVAMHPQERADFLRRLSMPDRAASLLRLPTDGDRDLALDALGRQADDAGWPYFRALAPVVPHVSIRAPKGPQATTTRWVSAAQAAEFARLGVELEMYRGGRAALPGFSIGGAPERRVMTTEAWEARLAVDEELVDLVAAGYLTIEPLDDDACRERSFRRWSDLPPHSRTPIPRLASMAVAPESEGDEDDEEIEAA